MTANLIFSFISVSIIATKVENIICWLSVQKSSTQNRRHVSIKHFKEAGYEAHWWGEFSLPSQTLSHVALTQGQKILLLSLFTPSKQSAHHDLKPISLPLMMLMTHETPCWLAASLFREEDCSERDGGMSRGREVPRETGMVFERGTLKIQEDCYSTQMWLLFPACIRLLGNTELVVRARRGSLCSGMHRPEASLPPPPVYSRSSLFPFISRLVIIRPRLIS